MAGLGRACQPPFMLAASALSRRNSCRQKSFCPPIVLIPRKAADILEAEAHHHLVPAQHLPEGGDRGGKGKVALRRGGGPERG